MERSTRKTAFARIDARSAAGALRGLALLGLASLSLASLASCASSPGGSPGAVDAVGPAGDPGPPASSIGSAAPVEETGPSTLPVAVDLVSVLVQLDGHSPYGTTIQVNEQRGGFGASLVEALDLAGYGLQVVSDDQGLNYLSHSASRQESQAGERAVMEMRLRDLVVSRTVTVVDGAYVPVGPVDIRGAEPQAIALNGSVYVRRPDRPLSYPSGVRFLAAGAAVDEPGGGGVGGDDGNGDAAVIVEALHRYSYWPTGALKTSAGDASPPDPTRFVEQATARLYEGGERAFSLRPATDFTVRQSVALRFPTISDALLGADNRRGLERLVRFFVPDTDRLSVASCSPDGTRTDSSVARSARVKAELLTLGAPGDQVVEPGCPEANRRSTTAPELAVSLERLTVPQVQP